MADSRSVKVRLEQFRELEREATDPFAARLVHEIVKELEARLENADGRTAKPGMARVS